MKKRKMILTTLILSLVLILCSAIGPETSLVTTVEAATLTQTQKKAKAAYNWFLQESDYTYFRFFDVNKDNLKELLVSHDNMNGHVCQMIVYTYRNGKIVRAGENYSAFGVTYNAKTKRIQGSRGGGGGIENWYYTFKSGKLKQVYLQMIENGLKNGKMTYKYYYNGKRI